MTVLGSEVGGQLQQQVEQLRERHRGLTKEALASDQRIDQRIAKHGDVIVELAKHYLPNIESRTIEKTYAEVRVDLQSIESRQQRHCTQLEQRLRDLDKTIQESQLRLSAVTATLNGLVAERESLEATLAQQLNSDVEYQRLSRATVDLERELSRNRRRADEVQLEAKEKLPSYDSSELFQYLYQRGYGSPSYRGFGPFRSLDRKVASLIGFTKARRSYDFLRCTPEIMRIEIERRAIELEELLDTVDNRQQAAADQIGLTPILEQGDNVGQEREQLVASLGVAQQERSDVGAEFAALDSQQSEFYGQAIDRMRAFLDATDQAVRESRAKRTADREDDAIVAEIGWLESQLKENREESQRLAAAKVSVLSQIEGVEYVVRRFRQSEFDSKRSQFPDGFTIADHVERFLQGNTNREGLWVVLSQNQHFEPTWMESTARNVSRYVERDATRAVLSAVVNVAAVGLEAATRYQGAKRGGSVRGRPGGNWFTGGSGF